jgi:hypothetical protein
MKTLTDRGILWRTFPVMPRKRVKFNPEKPVEFTLFECIDPVFKCLGGYFTHNTYNFLDWIVSYWNEMAARDWIQRFRQDRPGALNKQLENLPKIAPVLGYGKDDLLKLKNNLPELQQPFRNYVILPRISDLEMRKHPALERLSSRDLHEVIERSSKAKIKTIYPVRVLDGAKRDPRFTYFYEMNLKDSDPWGHLFEYRLLEERRSKAEKVIERVYKFGFTGLISALMIHNTICGASWNMNPVFYGLSADAQLFYRYLVVAGSRNKVNRVDYIGHRLGWKESQKKRLAGRVEKILKEIQGRGLIENAAFNSGRKGIYLCSFNIRGKRG